MQTLRELVEERDAIHDHMANDRLACPEVINYFENKAKLRKLNTALIHRVAKDQSVTIDDVYSEMRQEIDDNWLEE